MPEIASVRCAVEVRRLGAVRELHAPARSLVVERQLFAAIPVRVVEARDRARRRPAVVEVPDELGAGVGIGLAVDLVDRERLPGGVALERTVGAELRLSGELRGGFGVDGRRRVVRVEGTDLELHPLEEEEVAIRPDFLGEEGFEFFESVEGNHVARFERRSGCAAVIGCVRAGNNGGEEKRG